MTTSTDVVTQTIEEVQGGVNRERALTRLKDWRDRVHQLYEAIERGLGPDFAYDRSGKHYTFEELVQRSGLKESEVPAVDILRVEKPSGTLRALLQPQHLWIIGANGRLDLILPEEGGPRRRWLFVIDLSSPLSGKSDWRLVYPSDSLHQPPFTVDKLRELLRE